MTLKDIFELASKSELEDDFLYLPNNSEWTLATQGEFIAWTDADDQDADLPLKAQQKNLIETLDGIEIMQCVAYADSLSNSKDNSARLEIFLYFYRYDNYPDTIGAPEPSSNEECLDEFEKEFYQALGKELPGTTCNRKGCNRGRIRASGFCKAHHFEQIHKKTCPFTE